MIWLWFVLIQLVQLVAMIVGWIVLIPFCILQAWKSSAQLSIKGDGRTIDEWRWSWLNYVYGNPEDGVSGLQAVVWPNGVSSPYMATSNPIWRSYCWSALRNSCDNLKYVLANKKGPLKEFKFLGRTCKVGWQMENGFNVPVLSL